MKNSIHYFLNLFIGMTILLCMTTQAKASVSLSLTPYIGIAAQALNQKMPGSFGGNVIKGDYAQANIFAGLRFCDYLGIEGGYETTPLQTYMTAVPAGSTVFDAAVVNPPEMHSGKSQIRDWHASLVAFLPITDQCFKFLASIGVTRAKVFYYDYIMADAFSVINPFAFSNTFAASKTVLRLGAGAIYMINDCAGVRALVGWNNTSRFHQIKSKEDVTRVIKLENSWNYGLGFFVEF